MIRMIKFISTGKDCYWNNQVTRMKNENFRMDFLKMGDLISTLTFLSDYLESITIYVGFVMCICTTINFNGENNTPYTIFCNIKDRLKNVIFGSPSDQPGRLNLDP